LLHHFGSSISNCTSWPTIEQWMMRKYISHYSPSMFSTLSLIRLQRVNSRPLFERCLKYTHCMSTEILVTYAPECLLQLGFEVLTAVSTKMAVFWVVAPCSQVEVYHRLRGPCCLHHQGLKGLWNVGKLLPDYTALQSRRQPSSFVTVNNI
jgi:hypothetical protein